LQTAQIVAALPDMPEIQVDSGLISGSFRLGELQRLVDGAGREAHLLFVGHEPDMSALTYSLCGAQIAMKKGGLAHIETLRAEPEEGFLRWLLAPGQLALLGE
jgi:phosphohistidine phosphatase SixA